MRLMLLLCAGLALTVGISTASAGGGNSDAAKACQQGGWQNLIRSDGTGFKNTGDCVSYAAQGGTLEQKACTTTAGSENFSGDAEFSQPTTFSGGTIDTAYGSGGGVLVQGSSWGGAYAAGTHVLFTGFSVNSFQLTFTNAVGCLQLDAESNFFGATTNVTLTAYDASNAVVGTNSASQPGGSQVVSTLSVSSTSNNIKYFTIATDDPNQAGVGFSNIAWGNH
jgi:hypothetical protein